MFKYLPSIKVLLLVGGNFIEIAFKLGYMQLWMFCLYYFPKITNLKLRLEMRTG